MIIRFNLLGHRFSFQAGVQKLRLEYINGYTNRCKDGKYIVTLDYDNTTLEILKEELKFLQEYFWLGDFYIFRSSADSYHAVCLDKLVLSRLLLVLRNSSVDPRYIEVPLHHGKKLWTLRVSEKEGQSIKLVETLYSDAGDHSQSLAHADLLKKLFKIKAKLYKPDNLTELIFARYPI